MHLSSRVNALIISTCAFFVNLSFSTVSPVAREQKEPDFRLALHHNQSYTLSGVKIRPSTKLLVIKHTRLICGHEHDRA